MIESLFNILTDLLYESYWLSVFSSFIWGILSIILSPCHLATIPLVVGFLSSQGKISLARSFSLSLVFALGILVTIALIGGITLALGRIMGDIGATGNYIVAGLFVIVGLYLMDLLKLPWDGARLSSTKYKGHVAALIFGLIFGIGLGPCTFGFMAPVLGVVFEVSSTDVILASSLLIAFSAGHCIVIVFAGTFTKIVQKFLNWNENRKAVMIIKRICGVLVILAGFYLVYITF